MSYAAYFRAKLRENFANFLEENFDSKAEMALWCSKSERQIDNYLELVCAPGPEVVALAFTDPDTAQSAHRHLDVFHDQKETVRRGRSRLRGVRERPARDGRRRARL